MKAIGYTRVSTTGQANDGVSLDAQRSRIEAWSMASGRELVAVHTDAGISGAKADRPGLHAALEACQPGDALVVYSLSRLGRSTGHLIALADDLRKRNVDLVSITEGIDCTTAAGRLMYTMIAGLASFEREQVSERTRATLDHLKASGRVYGPVPYGYRRQGNKLVPDSAAMQVLERIQVDRGDGFSLQAIADNLNRDNIPAARGGRWHSASVRSVLTTTSKQAEAISV